MKMIALNNKKMGGIVYGKYGSKTYSGVYGFS